MTPELHGFCHPDYRAIETAFLAGFNEGLEVGSSIAVMRHGEPVVDLWAGFRDFETRTRPWEEDTIVMVHSTTKIATILSFLMLVDRGLVELEAPVATYWPQFATGGKGHVTVREALSHRAGVPGFVPAVPFEFIQDWDACVANIAAQTHWFGGDSQLCYHGITYGYVLGEVMRRVDGRKPTQFFREEIAEPAGIDLQIGLAQYSERARVAGVGFLTPPTGLPGPEDGLAGRVLTSWGKGDVSALPAFCESWESQRADYPSGNAFTNARAIARMCAIPAGGGMLDGHRYLSKALIDEASSLQVEGVEPQMGMMRMGLGFGLHIAAFPAPSPTSFHWGGFGGSFGVMDQMTGISAGYAQNSWAAGIGDRRRGRLWKALGVVMAGVSASG